MATRRKRRRINRRQRKIRRLKRKIKMWTARILVLSVLILVPALILWAGIHLFKKATDTKAAFAGAKIMNGWDLELERDPDKTLIVLDAGHGGNDQGTCNGDVLEKDINLAVTLKLAQKLQESDVEVILTRSEDVKVGLEERAEFANTQKANIFVSIHCNYFDKDSSIYGLECYYRDENDDGAELAEKISQSFQGVDEVKNRGIKTADYRVLRKTDMPAVLIEIGYLSNPTECKNLTNDEYQELLVEKIAAGILQFSLL